MRVEEVHLPAEAVHLLHDDMYFVTDGELLLRAAPHQRLFVVTEDVEIALEAGDMQKAKGHRLGELHEETVIFDIGNDSLERILGLFVAFQLEKL